jgi:hypothetical protein
MLRPTVSRPVCLGAKHPSGAYEQIFVTVRQLWICWRRALSLTRERVSRLQLLPVLASAVILGSESRGTRDHILLSQILDSPTLESQVLVFIFPRNKVTQLYPQALGSLYFASFDSHVYSLLQRSCLYYLGTDRTENTVPCSCFQLLIYKQASNVVLLLLSPSLPCNRPTCHNVFRFIWINSYISGFLTISIWARMLAYHTHPFCWMRLLWAHWTLSYIVFNEMSKHSFGNMAAIPLSTLHCVTDRVTTLRGAKNRFMFWCSTATGFKFHY